MQQSRNEKVYTVARVLEDNVVEVWRAGVLTRRHPSDFELNSLAEKIVDALERK